MKRSLCAYFIKIPVFLYYHSALRKRSDLSLSLSLNKFCYFNFLYIDRLLPSIYHKLYHLCVLER